VVNTGITVALHYLSPLPCHLNYIQFKWCGEHFEVLIVVIVTYAWDFWMCKSLSMKIETFWTNMYKVW